MHNLTIRQPTEALVKLPNIGRLLFSAGKISAKDAHRILHMQRKGGLRFGDAAVRLGLVTEEDISYVLSMQFHYPCLPADSVVVDRQVIAALRPHDPQVEALRALRNQIAFRWYSESRAMVVTAPSAGQGASRIAANLAVLYAQMGASTLLIDADMRNPRQHELFKLQSSPGLSDFLAGRAGPDVAQSIEQLTNLFVLPAGTEPPNPSELLVRPTMNELINGVCEKFDVVIIDTPPALECTDAQTLSARARGALIVARRHYARVADIEEVKQQLAISGAQAVGAVLTEF